MLALVFSVAGCSSKDSGLEYDEAKYQEATEFLVSYCASSDEAVIDQWKSLSDDAIDLQLMQSGYPFTGEGFLGALDAWQAGVEECGEYMGHGAFEYTVSQTELSVSTEAEFSGRNADLEVIYKADIRGNLYLDSLTIGGKYTMGEILKKAGLNTLLGMGTVFVVLIIISVIISLLKYIPKLLDALSGKNAKETAQEKTEERAPAAAEAAVEETAADDGELVAVIAAAIAAAEGTSTDGFVVRSIKRRRSNKWN